MTPKFRLGVKVWYARIFHSSHIISGMGLTQLAEMGCLGRRSHNTTL
jgi:hypothetical protein